MKSISACIVFALILTTNQQAAAKIWRVNNMPGVTADFTTAQAAHDGATAGDTIHLEPSVNNYGTVSCSKPLIWLSIGNFLAQNPGVQASPTPGILSTMYMYDGSNGSIVSVVSSSSITIYAPNITVNRSYFGSTISVQAAAVNTIITQNFLPFYLLLYSTNTLVSNNIIGIGISMSGENTSAIITNNVLNYYLSGIL